MDSHKVALLVDGKEYAGWKTISISAGVERQARDFDLAITWRWPESGGEAHKIKLGSRCEVKIGGDLVLTGYVFATPISYDARQVTLGVSGRSLTADVVDCSAARNQWRRQSVADVVKALVQPYGITVVNQVSDAISIVDHQVDPGETVFASIDRLLSASALLSTDDEYGRLVLADLGSAGRATDEIRLGEGGNVLSGGAEFDFSQVFSEYECIGQKSGDDDSFGEGASEVQALASDDRIARYRNLTVEPQGQVTTAIAARRVNWERGSRMGRALKAEYVILGWRQSDGSLWRHNMIVRVVDSMMGFDRDMLIVEIKYVLDEQGTRCECVVAPPEMVAPEPQAPKKGKKSGKKGKSGDSFEYLLPEDWEKKL